MKKKNFLSFFFIEKLRETTISTRRYQIILCWKSFDEFLSFGEVPCNLTNVRKNYEKSMKLQNQSFKCFERSLPNKQTS